MLGFQKISVRILHVIDTLGRGGAETLLVGVVNGLVQHEHCIVTLYDINEFEAELANKRIISLGCKGKISLLAAICKLRKIINDFSPEIVHSHLYWSSVIARIACPPKIKLFYSNHCIQSFEAFKNKWLVRIEQLTLKNRHTLISVSKAVEDDYKKFVRVKGKHVILYNYVEDAFFQKEPKTFDKANIRCIAIGRMAHQKNYNYLISHFPVSEQISLEIYGKDDAGKSLFNLIHESGNPNIFYKGVSKNMKGDIRGYDLFVMSSLYEGQPVSVLEAMASRLPVLLSDIPVMREAGADAALYFDIQDGKALIKLLTSIKDGIIDIQAHSEKCYLRATEIARKGLYLKKLMDIYQH